MVLTFGLNKIFIIKILLTSSIFSQVKLSELPLLDTLKATDRFLITQYQDSLDVITGDSVFQSRVATWTWMQEFIADSVKFTQADTLDGRITTAELSIQRNIDSLYQHLLRLNKYGDTLSSHSTSLLQSADSIAQNAQRTFDNKDSSEANYARTLINADSIESSVLRIIKVEDTTVTLRGAVNINALGISSNVIYITEIEDTTIDLRSDVTQTAIELNSTVTATTNNADSISEHSTQFNQTAEQINLRVRRDSILSEINLSEEGAFITGDRIQLDGDVSVTGLFTLDSGIVKSSNWSTTAGSYFDLANGTLTLGGSASDNVTLQTITGGGQLLIGDASDWIAVCKFSIGTCVI